MSNIDSLVQRAHSLRDKAEAILNEDGVIRRPTRLAKAANTYASAFNALSSAVALMSDGVEMSVPTPGQSALVDAWERNERLTHGIAYAIRLAESGRVGLAVDELRAAIGLSSQSIDGAA